MQKKDLSSWFAKGGGLLLISSGLFYIFKLPGEFIN